MFNSFAFFKQTKNARYTAELCMKSSAADVHFVYFFLIFRLNKDLGQKFVHLKFLRNPDKFQKEIRFPEGKILNKNVEICLILKLKFK